MATDARHEVLCHLDPDIHSRPRNRQVLHLHNHHAHCEHKDEPANNGILSFSRHLGVVLHHLCRNSAVLPTSERDMEPNAGLDR